MLGERQASSRCSLPLLTVLFSCSSSGAGPGYIPWPCRTERTRWTTRMEEISPGRQGSSTAASPTQSPSSRWCLGCWDGVMMGLILMMTGLILMRASRWRWDEQRCRRTGTVSDYDRCAATVNQKNTSFLAHSLLEIGFILLNNTAKRVNLVILSRRNTTYYHLLRWFVPV